MAVNYRNCAEAQQVVDAITGAGGCAMAVRADVCPEGDVERMVKLVAERLGPVDTLVLNLQTSEDGEPACHQAEDGRTHGQE